MNYVDKATMSNKETASQVGGSLVNKQWHRLSLKTEIRVAALCQKEQ
jgi:hypothetical protein